MASLSLSPPTLSSSPRIYSHCSNRQPNFLVFQFQFDATHTPSLQVSRNTSNFRREGNDLGESPRNWSGSPRVVNGDYGDYDDEDEDDFEEDRSLDLLVKFVQNIFKKISRKARKAVRSVLPITISAELVGFSVNGVIMLTFLWLLKAFLEVVCTLGSAVFVSILLIRGIWTGILYLQDSRYHGADDIVNQQGPWTGSQPAA